MDDIIIERPFETDTHIFGVWHKYLDATFFIAACILLLTALVINVAHRYQRTRDRSEERPCRERVFALV